MESIFYNIGWLLWSDPNRYILKAVKYPEISYRKFCGDDKRYEKHKETSPYIGHAHKSGQ